jgi:hypothetical protein
MTPYTPLNGLGDIPDSADREVAQFKLSVGVVGASVTLHEGRWQRFKARFRNRSIEENLGIAGADAFIRVLAADDATPEVQLVATIPGAADSSSEPPPSRCRRPMPPPLFPSRYPTAVEAL